MGICETLLEEGIQGDSVVVVDLLGFHGDCYDDQRRLLGCYL